jgi:hypothetical protein
MPFKSEAQRRYLWAKHPEIAQKWADEEKKSFFRRKKKKIKVNPDLALGTGQRRLAVYDPLVDKLFDKIAELKVRRGFIDNTVEVDGENYKVNEGYFKPALLGFGIAGLAHAAISGVRGSGNAKASLMAGALGAATSIGISELKRMKIQKTLNENSDTAKSIARRGFNIRARTNESIPSLSGIATELLKESSLSESKMIRKLDQIEDDSHTANSLVESTAILGLVSDLKENDSKRFVDKRFARAISKVNIAYTAMADKDDRIADASAGAQFVMYTPRMIDDIRMSAKGGRSKLIGNAAYSLARATPALAPIAARYLKKKYSDS